MRKSILIALVLTNLIALPLLVHFNGRLGSQRNAAEGGLPALGRIGEFQMSESSGEPFTRSSLQGRVWIVSFMFTRCPGRCPALNLKIQMLQKSINSRVGLLSISVDPTYDTPERLDLYARNYAQEKGRWFFLTGDKAELDKVLSYCNFGTADDPNLHGMKIVLIDTEGIVRGYYDYDDKNLLKNIRYDIKSLQR